MVLTLRTNGSGGSNIITATWFNDYFNLLTGAMSDQPVTINNSVVFKQITYTTPPAPTLTLHTGTGPGIGSYTYAVSFGEGIGVTVPGTTGAITTTTGNQQVTLSAIPVGPTGTTSRVLYRSKVGTTTPLYQLATIADNTTTTFLDTIADTSLTLLALAHGSFGGTLQIQNQFGVGKAQIYTDGAMNFDAGNFTSDGAGNVSAVSLTAVGGNVLLLGGTLSLGGGKNVYLNNTAINSETPNTLYSIAVAGGGSGKADYKIHNGTTGFIVLDGTAKQVSLRDGSNTSWLDFRMGTTFPVIQNTANNNGIGFQDSGGQALAEMKGGGNLIIHGTTYFTDQTTFVNAANGVFDAFDFSEVFQVDKEYQPGTLVCPADITTPIPYDGTPQAGIPILTQCSHDACTLAGVIVSVPGFCAGSPNVPSMQEYDSTRPMKQAVAQTGRVFMTTTAALGGKAFVCSDGTGGVRAVAVGEKALALGVTLSPTSSGMVPVLIRPTFVSL